MFKVYVYCASLSLYCQLGFLVNFAVQPMIISKSAISGFGRLKCALILLAAGRVALLYWCYFSFPLSFAYFLVRCSIDQVSCNTTRLLLA